MWTPADDREQLSGAPAWTACWAGRLAEPGRPERGAAHHHLDARTTARVASSSDSIVLTVLADPSELVAEDGLVVSPSVVYLYPSRGQPVATLTIENQNMEQAIGWAAAWNAAWLTLNPDDGTTPGEITVQCSLDPNGAPGTYTDEIAFTSPAVPGQTLRVRVEAVIGDKTVRLPILMRP